MRTSALLVLLAAVMLLDGCGGTPSTSPLAPRVAISVVPSTVVAGSSDLTVTITGSNFAGETVCPTCPQSVAVWSVNSSKTVLQTTFVSSTELTAVIPQALLSSPTAAQLFVETLNGQNSVPQFTTDPVTFSVTQFPIPAIPVPVIASISPSSAAAGSSDLTVTITGSNFEQWGKGGTSIAFWNSTNTMLSTTFVSSTQLTAIIPATLLQTPTTDRIFVMTGDPMSMSDGYFGYPMSNSVSFTVGP